MRSLICFLALCVSTSVLSQELPNPKPTEAHKVLAAEVGTWDCAFKMFFAGPDQPGSEFKGVETNKLVGGGLFVHSDFKSQMGDRAFEGQSLMGYDHRTKTYIGTWVDSFSSVPTQMKGTYDEKTKTMTVVSKIVSDENGEELVQRQVTTWVDENTKKFEIFLVVEAGGQKVDVKLMDMTSRKRVKQPAKDTEPGTDAPAKKPAKDAPAAKPAKDAAAKDAPAAKPAKDAPTAK